MKFTEIDLRGSKLKTLSVECTYLLLESLYFIVAFYHSELGSDFASFFYSKVFKTPRKCFKDFFPVKSQE